jgi:hypothetical protein
MAKVTEQDIINYLKAQVRFHQQQAKRMESLLAAFDTPGESGGKTEADVQPQRKTAKFAKANAVKPADQ